MLKSTPRFICVMGDSLSDNQTLGVLPHYEWPALLAAKMRAAMSALKIDVYERNFAKNGSRTDQQLALMPLMTQYGTPDYAIIWGGANDAGGGLTTAQTQANLGAMVKWLEFGCKGVVATEADLPVAAVGDRYVVMADGSANGGIDAPAGQGLTARIAGAGGGAQTVWECRYSLGGATAWGRIATAATAADRCKRIILGGAQYLNYSANGGDNNHVATGKRFVEGTSNDDVLAAVSYGPYATLRAAQAATAAAEGVVYCDNYGFVSGRIAAGLHTQGSFAEHYADGNQHFNRYGHSLLAEAYFETIVAQAGWLS